MTSKTAPMPYNASSKTLSRRQLFRRFSAIGIVSLLPNCAGSQPPSTKLVLDIDADPQINVNEAGQPSPIVVRLYELKDLAAFTKADFFDLFDDDAKALGSDLVNRREFEIKPGDKIHIEDTAGSTARQFAVVAGFRDQQNATWRDTRTIDAQTTNRLIVKVTALAVHFDVGEYHLF